MSTQQEEKKIIDKKGFMYDVQFKHFFKNGVSIAYYKDGKIASREYGPIHPPESDDDREWEEFQERIHYSLDAINSDLILKCTEHFNINVSQHRT